MPEVKIDKLPHAKSYTSIYDIFGAMSYGNVFHIGLNKPNKDQSVIHTSYGESANQSIECEYPMLKSPNYVTSEKYHSLNNNISSSKTIAPSTSTLFYDLDDIAKRHSFHCLTELSMSNANIMKVVKMPGPPFGKTSIVQECATQIHPKLLPRDSRELNTKKVKRQISKDLTLSSEIFLRDDNYLPEYPRNNHHYKDIPDRHQKFWSYAKYRTEYTKPIPEEKKCRRKDKGKRTENPCPCQLFSYACPCTDKKSLTELAKNSRSLTLADQRTSTTQTNSEEKKDSKSHKSKKHKRDPVREDKPTNTSAVEMIEVIVPKMEPAIEVTNKQDEPVLIDKNNVNKIKKPKSKSRKKPRRVLCPNCKENVDVVISISTTEEEESLKYEHSSVYRSKEIPSTAAYAYRASPNSNRSNNMEDGDLCLHEPRCEMLPVCQILPNQNLYNVNTNCANKKHSAPKSTPRIIRITKACRHHPPCTVVPSCQRANVLKNNCEYIPPCLHRPRCVNLPLCVPFSKSLHYEEATNKLVDDMETSDCPHMPRCKYIPMCHHDSLAHVSNTVDQQINMVSRVQNACELLTDYTTPAFLVNPKTTCVASSFSPCPMSPNPLCYTEQYSCRLNKSCQFDCSHCKCANDSKEFPSDEAVVFIRDVGCQFRNKNYSPKASVLQSKDSSNSFDFVNVKMGNYYTNVHTLRYEDKCTSPLSREALSFSTGSITSMELDSECPSHGRRANVMSRRNRPTTGFTPKSAYVTAFSTVTKSIPIKCDVDQSVMQDFQDGRIAFPIKSRRSFLKGKYRKMFSVKRKRKSRINAHVFNCGSEKLVPIQSQ